MNQLRYENDQLFKECNHLKSIQNGSIENGNI